MRAPRIVLACDKFKGSLTAAQVADALTAGLRRAHPGAVLHRVPVADGGDGTLAAAEAAGFTPHPITVTGPTGEAVRTQSLTRGTEAVVELADCCGLLRLPDGVPAPLTASSRGLGDAILAALDTEPARIIVGLGGSASTDGGAGLLTALGARLLDAEGHDLEPGGGPLRRLAELDLTGLDPRLADTEILLASDVTNPLLGPSGAAAVFAPQKGADPDQVAALEASLTNFAAHLTRATGRDVTRRPGAGAAGGVGYAALAALDASLRTGIEVVLAWSDFAHLLRDADLVITGEGSLDDQTLLGKTPAGVAAAARAAGVPVIAVCGRSTLTPADLERLGIARAYALTDLEPDPERCLTAAAPLLTELAARLARDLTTRAPGPPPGPPER